MFYYIRNGDVGLIEWVWIIIGCVFAFAWLNSDELFGWLMERNGYSKNNINIKPDKLEK